MNADTAVIWPSRAAMQQALSREAHKAPGGVLFKPPFYTFDSLLPQILRQVNPPGPYQKMSPATGPLLVQDFLTQNCENNQDLKAFFSGLSRGRRLPFRLWRFMVEMNAAGITSHQLLESSSPSFRALGLLLDHYRKEKARLGLMDQADLLNLLEEQLQAGRYPQLIKNWDRVEARQVLWLRTLDLRLLRALSSRIPVDLEFCLTPEAGVDLGLLHLLETTAKALESDKKERISLIWPKGEGAIFGANPQLADWLMASLSPGLKPPGEAPDQGRLVFLRHAGRQSEVQELLKQVLDLNRQGVKLSRMALVFPEPSDYFPLIKDQSQRMGVPLSHFIGLPLARQPLVQAILSLLELPGIGYTRNELASVLESPYLNVIWDDVSPKHGFDLPSGIKGLMAYAGYIDAREQSASSLFENAAKAQDKSALSLHALSAACKNIELILQLFADISNIDEYSEAVLDLIERLDLPGRLMTGSNGQGSSKTPAFDSMPLLARELSALSELKASLRDLHLSGVQLGRDIQFQKSRLFPLLRQTVAIRGIPETRSPESALKVLSLEQAAGVDLDVALIGGLSQGQFPRRPGAGGPLSGRDLVKLGKMAAIPTPVWRTDEEEYAGQILRLVWLMARARRKTVLSSPAAGSDGKELEPAQIMRLLAHSAGKKIPNPKGGVYRGSPNASDLYNISDLFQWLSHTCTQNHAKKQDRALAARLEEKLAQIRQPSLITKWRGIKARVRIERKRQELNQLGDELRRPESDHYSGVLETSLGLFQELLDESTWRRLSAGSLEDYAACPMAWFLGRVLGLSPLPEPHWDMERSLEGEWVHQAMRLLLDPKQYDHPPGHTTIHSKALQALTESISLVSKQNWAGHQAIHKARLMALASALTKVTQRELKDMPPLRPRKAEAWFGDEEHQVAVDLENEKPVFLTGRIDRLDIGENLVRVADYKHTRNPASLKAPVKTEDLGVTAFQIPVYLAAAKAFYNTRGKDLVGRIVPTCLLGEGPLEVSFEADGSFLAQGSKERAELAQKGEPNLFNSIAGIWAQINHGEFTPRPGPETCRFCKFASICRAEAPAMREADSR